MIINNQIFFITINNIYDQQCNTSKLSYLLLLYICVTYYYNLTYFLQKNDKNLDSNNYISTKFFTR